MSHRRGLTVRFLIAAAVGVVAVGSAVSAVAAPASATITGRVTGDGLPLRGVTVEAVDVQGINPSYLDVAASTKTAADGSYRLTGVPPYARLVQFVADRAVGGTSATGYADQCHGGSGNCLDSGRAVHVAPGGTLDGVGAALSPAGALRGRLTDSLGRGVAGLEVTLWADGHDQSADPSAPVYRVTTSDVDGNFAFPRLYDHTWSLCYGRPLFALTGTPNRDGYVSRCTDDRATVSGRTTTVNVRLAGGGGVAGTVVDPAGQPVPGAYVDVFRTQFDSPNATGGADGRFRVGGLPPGRQELCVSAPGFTDRCRVVVDVVQLTTVSAGRIVLQRAS